MKTLIILGLFLSISFSALAYEDCNNSCSFFIEGWATCKQICRQANTLENINSSLQVLAKRSIEKGY